jgi:hypothetical protein
VSNTAPMTAAHRVFHVCIRHPPISKRNDNITILAGQPLTVAPNEGRMRKKRARQLALPGSWQYGRGRLI